MEQVWWWWGKKVKVVMKRREGRGGGEGMRDALTPRTHTARRNNPG